MSRDLESSSPAASIAAAPPVVTAVKTEAVIPVEIKPAETNHDEVKKEVRDASSVTSEEKASSPEPKVVEDEVVLDHVQDEETVDSSSKSGSQVKLRYDYKDGN